VIEGTTSKLLEVPRASAVLLLILLGHVEQLIAVRAIYLLANQDSQLLLMLRVVDAGKVV